MQAHTAEKAGLGGNWGPLTLTLETLCRSSWAQRGPRPGLGGDLVGCGPMCWCQGAWPPSISALRCFLLCCPPKRPHRVSSRTADPPTKVRAQGKLNTAFGWWWWRWGGIWSFFLQPPPHWLCLHLSESLPGPRRTLPSPPSPFSAAPLPSELRDPPRLPWPRSALLPLASSIDPLQTVPFLYIRNYSSRVPAPQRLGGTSCSVSCRVGLCTGGTLVLSDASWLRQFCVEVQST